MPEKKKQKTYSGEFKIEVVETMRKENLSYKETVRHFGLRSDKQVRMWERIYLEEGKEALLLERRGRVGCVLVQPAEHGKGESRN